MKTFNFFIFLILFSTVFVSCGEKKTSPENNSMQQDTVGSKELAHIDYVCPMDCEKGKVYHEMGKCPKCKMDLIKKEHEDHDGHDHHEGDGHDHKKEMVMTIKKATVTNINSD
jgi:hypothetical protein